MKYRKLGSTGMMVSRIGFGGIPILRSSDKTAQRVLRRAFELGVNFVDTHRGYGDSEIKIGNALCDVREEVYLATKISVHTRSEARKSLKESLRRLKTRYIDLLFIKNLDSEEVRAQAMGRNGSLKVVREAQRAGVVRHIGFTSHTEKTAWKALRSGEYEAIMFPYNVMNTSAERRIFRHCDRKNIGFVCMKPVAGGLLTTPGRVFSTLTQKLDKPTGTVSVSFCASHPSVTTVIPGVNSIKQLREGLAALSIPMTTKQREQALREVKRIGEGFCRNCGYCKPCPQDVDINNVFRFYHYYTSYGLKEYAQAHYRRLKGKADVCARCGACVPRCPYKIDIPRKLALAHRVLAS